MNSKTQRHSSTFGVVALAVIAATGTTFGADYSSTVMGLGPVAYYQLNETTVVPLPDVATNSGTLGMAGLGNYLGGATHPVTGIPGAGSDTAAIVPNTDHSWGPMRIRVPFQPEFNQAAPFTAEFWAAPDQAGTTACPFASVDFNLATRYGWLFYQDNPAGKWFFRVYNQGGNTGVSGGTVTVSAWQHVVGVYDGTNISIYVNGALVGGPTKVANTYTPVFNPAVPLSIGGRGDGVAGSFGFGGNLDEVAFYTNALSGAEILAHYQAGIDYATPDYAAGVLAHHPAGYWRLGEPPYSPPDVATLPVAANSGTLGSAADGKDYPGVTTGVAGPPFSGFSPANTAYKLNGFVGNVGLGNPDGLNSLTNITLMAWIKPEFTDGLRDIVAHGFSQTPNQELFFRINAGAYQFGSWETSATVNSPAGRATSDVGNWVLLTGTYDGTTWKLYHYDKLIGSAAGGGWTAMPPDWSIGSRGDTSTDPRYFGGVIDEVAIFDRALSQSEIEQVLSSGNVPPIITQQPQSPTGEIIAGSPVTVPVTVVGTPTLAYQWMRSGTNVPGQTTSALTFGNIMTNDAGSYVLTASNPYGSVTSSVVTLTVTYPSAPATLAGAVAFPAYDSLTHSATLTELTLNFTGPLAQMAGDPSHYTIPGLTVSGARFTNMNRRVILTTSTQTQGASYTVTLTGITDGVGNPLVQNTADFRAWVSSPANGVLFEYYDGIDGTVVNNLLNAPLYPNQPTIVTNLWAFDSRVIFPDNSHEKYGARMQGVFVPPTSGNWRFFLRSDDSSQVFFNPNGPDPAGKQLILDETGCCGDWNKALAYTNAAPFSLVAGQAYYIEMLYKEGGGGDYGKVAAMLDGTGYPATGTADSVVDPAALNALAIGWPYAPADVGGSISLTGPASVSSPANHPVVFTASASNPVGLPMLYQWRRNGAAIPGATGTSYSLVATAADNNARFSVRVSKIGSDVISPDATLTVTADTDAPQVAGVHGSVYLNRIVVSFSELVAPPTPASFTVPGFTATDAILDASGTSVVVTFNNPLTPGQTYNLTVQNVADSVGNVLTSATVPVQTYFLSRGFLRFDYFGHLSQTDNVLDSTLLADPRFPDSPEWSGFLTAFETRTIFPTDINEGYGARITGLFIPPETGQYAFFLKSDDSSRFYLNLTGAEPIDRFSVAPLLEETACCGGFSKIGITNTETSVAGQPYYVEALLKEGGGGDHLEVAAKLGSDATPPDALSPVTGRLLAALVDPAGSSVTITQQPANVVTAWLGASEVPEMLVDANFNANNGGFTVVNYGNPDGPWSWNATAGSWTNHGLPCDPYPGPYASGLRSPVVTLTKSGGASVTLVHRYSFEGFTATDGTAWDGGQLRLSVNGGPFGTVPGANFTANGYLAPIGGNINTNLTATPGWINAAWVGESPNYNSRAFLTSVASLGNFNAGDTIQVEFVASWDDGCEGQEPNWEIDSVQLGLGAAAPAVAQLTVGAESTYLNQPNGLMAYIWQQDTGSGFKDIPEGSGPNLNLTLGLEDGVGYYRCLVYCPGAAATSQVATVTVTLTLSLESVTASSLGFVWPRPPASMPVTAFVLEQSPTMAVGSWTTVPTSTYVASAAKVRATVTQSGSPMFYRLRRN